MSRKRLAVFAAMLALMAVWLVPQIVLAQAGPSITITEPADGATVGPNVTLKWTSEGVTIVKAADAKELTEGHFHVFVDTDAITGDGQPIPTDNPKIIHTGANSLELKDLAPGEHKVTIVLGYSNHTPWQPPVTATVTFTVSDSPATLPASGGTFANNWLIALAGIVMLGGGLVILQLRPRQKS